MKRVTDKSFYESSDDVNYIRSSSLKSFESCSWLYYCSYVLKIPQLTNRGASMGNVCHSFFECLLNPRHKKVFNEIIKADHVYASKSSQRLILKFIKDNNLPADETTLKQVGDMILVGLKNDFYIKGGKIIGNEYRFKIQSEDPKYSIYGTMDKIAIKNKNLMIDDFKSSKKKYEGEEHHSNVQALFYSLAARKLWPDLSPKVRFIFLQFPEDPMLKVEYKENTLKGFEQYLAFVQNKIDNFTEEDAKSNFAADKEPKDKGFNGKLVCGFASRPNQLKKDGTKMWHCPYKFEFNYFVLLKDGKIRHSAFTKEELTAGEGESIELRHYDGCPRHKNALSNFTMPKIEEVKGKAKYACVLDDF